jgi:hypothetical protein
MRAIADSLSGKAETMIRMKIVKASSMLVAFSEDTGVQAVRGIGVRVSLSQNPTIRHTSPLIIRSDQRHESPQMSVL